MADKVLLPNTDIEIIEKYLPGRRADFPDFGSVCKTSFSKGVITDFKVTADDPITVESMVKVTGDFGESEYIPLFYHPKEKFWDDETADEPVLATDFDEKTGAFKRAWQSFRGDDEVVVMLKEGVPVAVLGHADGVPRIGENILKWEPKADKEAWGDDYLHYLKMDRQGRVGAWSNGAGNSHSTPYHQEDVAINAEKGPDDFDLKLVKEIEQTKGTPGTRDDPILYGAAAPFGGTGSCGSGVGFKWCAWRYYETFVNVYDPPAEQHPILQQVYDECMAMRPAPEPWGGGRTGNGYVNGYAAINHYSRTWQDNPRVDVWPVIVGPILYAFYVLSNNYQYEVAYYFYESDSYNQAVKDWCEAEHQYPKPDGYVTPPPPVSGSVIHAYDNHDNQDFLPYAILVKAAPYSDKLLEETIASVQSCDAVAALELYEADEAHPPTLSLDWFPSAPKELILQKEMTHRMIYGLYTQSSNADELGGFFTRPHTKAELQAAGLYPT